MRRALTALAVVVLAACGGVGDGDEADDRPLRLLDLTAGSIERIDVRDPATGRTGGGVPTAALAGDLTPLLAVRQLDRRLPEYGLDPPRLEVTVHTAERSYRLLVGAPNFDDTAVYVGVGRRTALVLPRVAEGLAALLDR